MLPIVIYSKKKTIQDNLAQLNYVNGQKSKHMEHKDNRLLKLRNLTIY